MNKYKIDDIEYVKQKILSNDLTGRCMEDTCTDGYDTIITLLALNIVEYFENRVTK